MIFCTCFDNKYASLWLTRKEGRVRRLHTKLLASINFWPYIANDSICIPVLYTTIFAFTFSIWCKVYMNQASLISLDHMQTVTVKKATLWQPIPNQQTSNSQHIVQMKTLTLLNIHELIRTELMTTLASKQLAHDPACLSYLSTSGFQTQKHTKQRILK